MPRQSTSQRPTLRTRPVAQGGLSDGSTHLELNANISIQAQGRVHLQALESPRNVVSRRTALDSCKRPCPDKVLQHRYSFRQLFFVIHTARNPNPKSTQQATELTLNPTYRRLHPWCRPPLIHSI